MKLWENKEFINKGVTIRSKRTCHEPCEFGNICSKRGGLITESIINKEKNFELMLAWDKCGLSNNKIIIYKPKEFLKKRRF